MMRSRFDDQLELLNEEMIRMGAMVERTIENACEALLSGDAKLATQVMNGDAQVDRKEREIETLCLRILLQQQPVAKDLRRVSSALKMITDMERIGDQAADISEIVTFIGEGASVRQPRHIGEMAKKTVRMVHLAIDAYVERNVNLARQVIASDDEVDALFVSVKGELAQTIRDDPAGAGLALDLLMIAKYFERIGDHAVNVAEWVEFAQTGLYKGEALS